MTGDRVADPATDSLLADHCDACRWWAENFDEHGNAREDEL